MHAAHKETQGPLRKTQLCKLNYALDFTVIGHEKINSSFARTARDAQHSTRVVPLLFSPLQCARCACASEACGNAKVGNEPSIPQFHRVSIE